MLDKSRTTILAITRTRYVAHVPLVQPLHLLTSRRTRAETALCKDALEDHIAGPGAPTCSY